jgi:4-hydroxybenzoyl-CoA thioesterase
MSAAAQARDAAAPVVADGAAWRTRHTVRFAHCDPAGIVFYPRYFEIAHDAKEAWFREALGIPFQQYVGAQGRGLPIVRLDAQFFAPSRHGDELDIAVVVAHLGRSSLHLHYAFACAGEPRVAIRTVIVQTDLRTGRPVPIDGVLRERIEALRAGAPRAEPGAAS